jgi:anti-sigma factor RsiW
MNCHEVELELGDYVEGALSPGRTGAVAAHVASCALCRATVADFTAIRGVAGTLEPHAPGAHMWHRIADAIDAEHRGAIETPSFVHTPWWRLGTGAVAWRPLAAAAAMLVLLTGGTWLAWHQASTTPVATNAALGTGGAGTAATMDSEVQLAEQHYSTAIGDLEKVTRTESGSLDPETVKVVQANLEVIDQAIGQSREALKAQPANPVAQESLFGALRSKVQLLQDTVALINEMRKGNQEGAARIMSGMNP